MEDIILYMFDFISLVEILSFRYLNKKMLLLSRMYSETKLDKKALNFKGYIKTPEYFIINSKINYINGINEHICAYNNTLRIIYIRISFGNILLSNCISLPRLKILDIKNDKFEQNEGILSVNIPNIHIFSINFIYNVYNIELFIDDSVLNLRGYKIPDNLYTVYKNIKIINSEHTYNNFNFINVINRCMPYATHLSFNADENLFNYIPYGISLNSITSVHLNIQDNKLSYNLIYPNFIKLFPNLKKLIIPSQSYYLNSIMDTIVKNKILIYVTWN